MEETDQELMRHVCKLCNKNFPCGRSLGGHMRSHVINSTDHHPHHHHQQKKKLSSLNNNGGKFTNKKMTVIDGSSNSNDSGGYELRKDPKKTLKAKDSSEVENNTTSCLVVLDKLCKECGKGFQSWKALFGHMKCHSDKVSNNHHHQTAANLGQDSWTSQSDNENSNSDAKSSRIKRSRSRNNRIKRYIVTSATTATVTTTTAATTTASSSISMNANANNNQISSINALTSFVSEVEQEQEAEIAMCLMMLSRDVGKWGNSQTESSAFIEANVVRKTKAESFKSRNGSKMKKPAETRVGIHSLGRSEVGFDGLEKSLIKSDEFDDQIESGFGKFEDPRKRKFECTTCNKSFHSYQALGGHRASHKKLKGCFDSKIQGENKIENQPMFDHEHTINGFGEKTSENHQATASFNLGGGASKKTLVLGAHECPICLRIFSSGQALGGHKRSHLIAEAKLNQQYNINEIEKVDEPVSKTRGFLDLNMPPAPTEEEEEEKDMILSSSIIGGYKPWYWAEGTNHHNSEPTLLGLLSTS